MESSDQTSGKSSFKIGKFAKFFLGLSAMAVFTNITVIICNYLNIPQTDYFLYLLWMFVVVIFFSVLPKKVNIEDYY